MIMLSRKTTYAVEAVLEIAQNVGADAVTMRPFAESKGVSHRYLEKVLQGLVRAGILKGVRGPGGGYRLARERRRVSVGDIVRVAETVGRRRDKPEPDFEVTSPLAEQVIHPLWQDVRETMMRELDGISLEELCRRAFARGLLREHTQEWRPHFDI